MKLLLIPLLALMLVGAGCDVVMYESTYEAAKRICIEKGGIPIESIGGGRIKDCKFI